ncbi:MAG: glucose 1-dehydrogenase [Acidimicrobiales bacterium]
MARLEKKVALITGGARGQGAAEAGLFASEGATVYITDVLDDEGTATADSLGDAVTYLHHDVTKEDEWASVVDRIVTDMGSIDVLVNNAGIFRTVSLFETTVDEWHRMVDINQTGVFLGLRASGQVMRSQGSGSIINISSIAGLGGAAVAFAYGATKWAVRGMTKSAALELAPSGVRVNSVHPGIIETAMLDEFESVEQVVSRIPAGRTASADEVAQLVLFLASDESAYCNGHEFVIDGAMKA